MKRKLLGFAIFLSGMIASPWLRSSDKYSLQDLEIISKQKNYWEFLRHAKDIRPHQRNKHWQAMVQNMATGLLEFNLQRKHFESPDHNLIYRVAHWPTLKKDEFFQVKYNRYTLHYIHNCLLKAKQRDCFQEAWKLWQLSKKDPETSYQIAQALNSFYPQRNTGAFLNFVATHPMAGFYCHRPFIVKQLAQRLLTTFRPLIIPGNKKTTSTPSEMRRQLESLAHPQCWKAFFPHLKKVLLGETPRHQIILHKILTLKGALSQEENDFFYTLYLLRGPLIGETFNQAWNNLSKIGQNYPRRARLLEALKGQDPLEGKVFASSNHDKQKTIMGHFFENFPEYLDFYGKTCLAYFEGKKTFPHGNPTPECREFFKGSTGTPWVSQSLRLRFSGIKK